MDFIYFLGRFHVLVLHLPIGIILAVITLEWIARRERYAALRPAATFLWGAAALTSIVTVALGYMHFSEGGFEGPSAAAHRFFGTTVAVLTTAIFLLKLKSPLSAVYARFHPIAALVLLALLTLTGHYGGNLTHGNTFLVQYAPAPIQRLAGIEPARPRVTDLAKADPYLDIVHPIFEARCTGCHNDDKQRGGLNLMHYASTMNGGEDGAVVAAGQPAKSELYRRITLPEGHDDFMPAEGKTPLTADQVKIIEWWIAAGAQSGNPIGTAAIPEPVRPLLVSALRIGAAGGDGGAGESREGPDNLASVGNTKPADPALLRRLHDAGFQARPVSLADPRLVVTLRCAASPATQKQLESLNSVATEVAELNLPGCGIDDAEAETLLRLINLTHLGLQDNAISDAGVARLEALAELRVLNVYGNRNISDRSLQSFAKLPKLERVYAWETSLSSQAARAFRPQNRQLRIDLGEEPQPMSPKLTQNE